MSRKRQQKASDDTPDKIDPGECVCLVKRPTGSSVFECWDGTVLYLVELPPRFRKSMWIRRGSYVIVKCYDTSPEGPTSKLHGEITSVLLSDDVKQWKRLGLWPPELEVKPPPLPPYSEETEGDEEAASIPPSSQLIVTEEEEENEEGDEDSGPLWENPNRK